ncbi:MBL fold metallo-hydrolase [Rhodoligotrophos defluvii]|uniref:MBL fold metallo-hydrolase n=1 Tax=Rhodoligotrophos defluvii TaxID=2561934 RepID=UPI0010C9E5B8|nr:MBL fold metallo-hydrolase [Rhodoligotrophos defluvii]
MSSSFTVTRRTAMAGSAVLVAGQFAFAGGVVPAGAAAQQRGIATPTVNRVKLGAFEITTVSDGSVVAPGPHPTFGANVGAEQVKELVEQNFLPADQMRNGYTPVVVNTGREVIVFDTGNGAERRPEAGNFAQALVGSGISPGDVDIVVITHFHGDHIGGLMENGEPVFPNARYVMGETEFDFWTSPDRASGSTANGAALVQKNVVPLKEKTTFVKGGDSVVSGITAIEAFGHTPGHMAFNIESNGQRLVLAADTANHYVASLQRPDWHVRFDMDKEAAAATRRKIFDMIAADRVPFTGYHMPFPAIGYVEKMDQGYRYVPATYQLTL